MSRYPVPRVVALGQSRMLGEPDAGALLAGVAVFIAAGLDREPRQESGVAALVAECVVHTAVGGEPLLDAVSTRGGSLSYAVDGRSVRYYIESRPGASSTLVGLLGTALSAPDFSAAAVAAARTRLDARIAEDQSSPLDVGIEMFRGAYYATSSGLPPLGTVAALAQLDPTQVRAYYAATYRRGAVAVTTVGEDADGPPLAEAADRLVRGLAAGVPAAVKERANALPAEAKRIIAQRDVSAPWVVLGFPAPPPGSADFGAVLVLESVLSNGLQQASTTAPSFVEKPVGAEYLYGSTPGAMVVYVNGEVGDASLGTREVLLFMRALAAKPLAAAPFARFKAAAEGGFLRDSLELAKRAYLLGALSSQGLGDDPLNAALASLERSTPADVQRVAKRYLQRYIVALVLPRAQSRAAAQ